MAVKTDIDIPLVLVIGAIGGLLLVVVLLGLRAWYTFETDRLTAQKNEDYTPAELTELKRDQVAHLAGGFWVSDGRGEHAAAAIPIRAAMARMAETAGRPTTLPARQPVAEEAKDADATTSRPATEQESKNGLGTGSPPANATAGNDARQVGDGSGPAGLPDDDDAAQPKGVGGSPQPQGKAPANGMAAPADPQAPGGDRVSQPEPGSDPN